MSRVTVVGTATQSGLTARGDRDGGGQPEDDKPERKKKKKAGKKPSASKGFGPGRDRMDRQRAPTRMPAGGPSPNAGLAVEGEGEASPEEQLVGLRKKLDEAESAFQFMGTGHPSYVRVKKEVAQLKAMIEALGG